MKKICIYPKIKKDNQYVSNYIKCLKGFKVIEFTALIKKPVEFFTIDYFHFNWIENIKSNSKLGSKFEYRAKKILIKFIKIFNKRVIWTMHNKKSHDTSKYSEKIINFMIVQSDKILIHSKESYKFLDKLNEQEINNKVIYAPHGNYIGNYKERGIDRRAEYNIKDSELVYMFIGQIKPYKNIEILIESYLECAFDNSKLIILGKANENYKKEIQHKYSKFKNIIFDFKFVDDDDMVDYINCADIFVTPYNIESSLNSGSIIMYFSYGKTVISPNIGTISDIRENFYYSYNYVGEVNHREELVSQFIRTKLDYDNNKNIFKIKGNEAYEYVEKFYSWNKVADIVVKLYEWR